MRRLCMLRPLAARHAGWYNIIREKGDVMHSEHPIPNVFKVRRRHFQYKVIIVLFIYLFNLCKTLHSTSPFMITMALE